MRELISSYQKLAEIIASYRMASLMLGNFNPHMKLRVIRYTCYNNITFRVNSFKPLETKTHCFEPIDRKYSIRAVSQLKKTRFSLFLLKNSFFHIQLISKVCSALMRKRASRLGKLERQVQFYLSCRCILSSCTVPMFP